jgi:hypothetical protein
MLAVTSWLLFSVEAYGSDFYAIVVSLGTKAGSAFMDVALDSKFSADPVDVLFDVFGEDGTPLAEFTATTNSNGFATTRTLAAPYKNLFRLNGGAPMLVRARVPNGAPAAAIVEVKSSGAPYQLSVPFAVKNGTPLAAGQFFPISIGNARSATLLVANVSGTDVGVDVHVGSGGPAGGGVYSTPRLVANAIWRVDLTPAEFNSYLLLRATDNVVVLAVTNTGKVLGYMPLPA